jgi:hypothetical protein
VTFITLPGIDDVSRISGFLAILLSAFSLISAVIALFRYKSDIEHPVAYPRGEGLILLSVCIIGTTFNLIANSDIEPEAAKCPPISSPGLSALRDRSIHYRHRIVCLPGIDITVSGRHFGDFTQWVVICTVGGLACILFTSQLLIH